MVIIQKRFIFANIIPKPRSPACKAAPSSIFELRQHLSMAYTIDYRAKSEFSAAQVDGSDEKTHPRGKAKDHTSRLLFFRFLCSALVCHVSNFQVENKRGTKLRRFQQWVKHILGYSPPIFFGCGLFNKYYGLLPFRTPINTIVGSPIDVKQNDSPSNEEIDAIHQEYCDQLSKLFDDHKEKYGIPLEAKLNIY
ncbi:diacylglycerol acyltransferase domain-containing protein [Ditylenchus destructor]|nr:diacylglycerol acyltransferase domain-containing protein [Ditylenchus destructor]